MYMLKIFGNGRESDPLESWEEVVWTRFRLEIGACVCVCMCTR